MWREITHTITGPGCVDSDFGGLVILSDHPDPADPRGRAPSPWFQFLASVGACVTSFVAGALSDLAIDPAGVEIVQSQDYTADDDVIPEFSFVIRVPAGFTAEQREAVATAAGMCTVKRVIEAVPEFRIEVHTSSSSG